MYYAYSQLEQQSKLSSDVTQPYKRLLPAWLALARRYKQVYITLIYSRRFGGSTDGSSEGSSDGEGNQQPQHYRCSANQRVSSLVQEVVPTRTGLDGLRMSNVLSLSKVDGEEPQWKDEDFLASVVFSKGGRWEQAQTARPL